MGAEKTHRTQHNTTQHNNTTLQNNNTTTLHNTQHNTIQHYTTTTQQHYIATDRDISTYRYLHTHTHIELHKLRRKILIVIAPAAVLDTALKVIEETASNRRKENQDYCNH
jgi:hypothetical protein